MTEKLRVFYDGACPLCKKEIGIYMRADKAGAIEWLDVSAQQQLNMLPLPHKTLLARFHVQRPNGELMSGARGFIEMWRWLPGWRLLSKACSLPGLPSILEVSYRAFLKVRPSVQRMFRP